MADSSPNTPDLLWRFLEVAGAGVVGFLSSIGAFRARFTAIERDLVALSNERARYEATVDRTRTEDHEYLERELARVRDECRDHVSRVEQFLTRESDDRRRYRRDATRRQLAILEIVADVATKNGVANRITDTLPRLLSEEIDNG